MMKSIAQALDQLQERYTVVVIGSGYGGSIAASRLARAGVSVCLLERGREILPGDYPDTLEAARAELQIDTAKGLIGSPQGLFNLHVNEQMFAMVGCGLGGTSLINANVALEMDPRLFRASGWPQAFRDDPNLLVPFAERARAMLDARPYPQDYPRLNKLDALERAADAVGQRFYRPPIAVNFVDQTNAFGVEQPKCNLCGDCTSGCNTGAKNTTLMNYLPDAHNHGASVFTGARVSHLSRDDMGWCVHIEDANGHDRAVAADVVILGAGSLGSTEILLRSRTVSGLSLSPRLGQHFSGNGDVLAWGYNSNWQTPEPGQTRAPNINGIGVGRLPVPMAARPGPCITGVIDLRGGPQVQRGLVIEEGVLPSALALALPPAMFFANAQQGGFFSHGMEDGRARLEDAKAFSEDLLNHPRQIGAWAYKGPVARTQTYLVMSVDDAGGSLELDHDRLRIRWAGVAQTPVYLQDDDWLEMVNNAVLGHLIRNPLSSKEMGHRLITVHPVGGCAMGDDAATGVVNDKCQVFSGDGGTDVHEGLYAMDGAVMPGAVGVNPLLTISAVAERASELLARDRGWTIDFGHYSGTAQQAAPRTPTQPIPPAVPAPSWLHSVEQGLLREISLAAKALPDDIERCIRQILDHLGDDAVGAVSGLLAELVEQQPDMLSPALEFSETMRGWISTDAIVERSNLGQQLESADELAAAWGRARDQTMRVDLTIDVADLYALTTQPDQVARVRGTVTCPALQPQDGGAMSIISGEWRFLRTDPTQVDARTMRYDMAVHGANGPLFVTGVKTLRWQPGSSWWHDLTTLAVQVHQGGRSGQMLARGVLTLGLEDLLAQMNTVKLQPRGDLATLLWRLPPVAEALQKAYLGRFAGAFGKDVFATYGGMLASLADFQAQAQPTRPRRALKATPPQQHRVALGDGFSILLTRYPALMNGGASDDKGPVILAPGFSVKASSFAVDTVDENLVEYLCAKGYDTWLFDYRASADSGSPLKPYTIDDIASVDWPAAVQHVLATTGAHEVQVIAHCVGSMSLLMALLLGMKGVRSVISSQLTLHPVTNWLNDAKADMNLVQVADQISWLDHAVDLVPSGHDPALDVLAWGTPKPAGECCHNPVCNRVFAFFGPSYTHAQLNHWTHVALMEMFSPVSLAPMDQLARIAKAGQVVDRHGRDTYMGSADTRGLAIPISFVAGGRNQLFFPRTSMRTYQWLRQRHNPDLYTWHRFDDYAHMDLFIGCNAAQDVFPYLLQELQRGARLSVPMSLSEAAAG